MYFFPHPYYTRKTLEIAWPESTPLGADYFFVKILNFSVEILFIFREFFPF